MTIIEPYYRRTIKARIVFSWLFLVLLYFFLNNSLLFQLQSPILIYPASDNSFWLLHILRIPQFLLHHKSAALSFDIILSCSVIICAILPDQKLFTWITVIGTWLFYITYCSAAGKHYAQMGYLITPVAFLAFKPEKFDLLWDAIRYWVCFLYVTGGLYKIYYGGFGHEPTMSNILQGMNAEWFVFNANSLQANAIDYLIKHPSFAQFFYRLVTVIDLSLILGFFTKRADKWLFMGLVSFHMGNYFLMHISFIEQSLIFAPFLPWQTIENYFHTNERHD